MILVPAFKDGSTALRAKPILLVAGLLVGVGSQLHYVDWFMMRNRSSPSILIRPSGATCRRPDSASQSPERVPTPTPNDPSSAR